MALLFDSLKKQLAAIGDERAQLLNKLEKAKQRHLDLQTRPLPLNEHVDKFLRQVDSFASHFSGDLKRRTAHLENKPLEEINPMTSLLTNGQAVGGQYLERMICGLFTDEVKEGIKRTALTWDWPDAGPPMREREAELKKLDKIIVDLERKLEEFDNFAEQNGVSVGQAPGGNLKHQLNKN